MNRAAINPNGVTSVVRLSDHRKIVPVTSVQVWQNANVRSGSMCPMLQCQLCLLFWWLLTVDFPTIIIMREIKEKESCMMIK